MTKPRYDDGEGKVWLGDCLDVMRELASESVDAIVTDPPYGLGFMGKHWDALPPGEPWARECLRVLKPGGHLLAFGGTRTWHRLAVAIEDAGFEVRDSIAWLYGSGFPKSLDVSKAIDKEAGVERSRVAGPGFGASFSDDNGTAYGTRLTDTPATPDAETWQGWGTALKPAFEPVVVARKPLAKGHTVAANVLAHGTGALNIDASRVGSEGGTKAVDFGETAGAMYGGGKGKPRNAVAEIAAGRWPANVMLDESQAAALDEQSGVSKSGKRTRKRAGKRTGTLGAFAGQEAVTMGHADQGGASRFFYVAKAPTRERPKTAEGLVHPTVKPLALMRQLVKLVTPPGGIVLDPFAGSGTTIEAAILEGFVPWGIERELDYFPLIVQRIARAHGV